MFFYFHVMVCKRSTCFTSTEKNPGGWCCHDLAFSSADGHLADACAALPNLHEWYLGLEGSQRLRKG